MQPSTQSPTRPNGFSGLSRKGDREIDLKETGKFGFPKEARLRNWREFARVYQGHSFAADQNLVMQAVLNSGPRSRLGVSVSRKVGNAVVRNRWKRLIREAFRLHQVKLQPSMDIVVRPRKDAEPHFRSIEISILKLFQRLSKKETSRLSERRHSGNQDETR